MALKQIEHGSEDYKKMIKLRYELLRRPLGLRFGDEELAREKQDILIGVFEEDKILGCCLLTKIENDDDRVRLRQLAVQNDLQGKGVGRAMVHFAENIARDRGYKILSMHARKNVARFFEKLGYKRIGDEFIEITIPHFIMEKPLV